MKVYVAGSSKEIERCEKAMAAVRGAGFELVFDWIENLRKTGKPDHELTFEEASMISAIEVQETPGKKATKGSPEIPATIVRKVRLRDNVPALRLLAQHRKLIGTEADEALSNIAAAFADRLASARARRRAQAKGE